ncbi:hypothetical protein [Phaffia rhodozyma]|uniref:Uncharacterized protein n=1 Tax=Phaffia rhodozyma TaxID=264483 RepID=A0A0F7SI84_PHARH|nr:hypothetical protein [Phaffia rhodozyma]
MFYEYAKGVHDRQLTLLTQKQGFFYLIILCSIRRRMHDMVLLLSLRQLRVDYKISCSCRQRNSTSIS